MRKTVPLLVSMALALLFASGVGLHTAIKPAEAAFPGQNGKIAYVSYDMLAPEATTDREIYAINPTGGTPFQLTDNNTLDDSPSYSPDGNTIAYTGFDGTDEEIYAINAGGGAALKVTNNDTDDGDPSWGSR
jgi:Tol biopolymer transport system component